jgi:feruloyl-CoA synthase
MDSTPKPPFRHVDFIEARVEAIRREGGEVILRSPHPMRPAAPNLIEPLRRWAASQPDATWLAQRGPDRAWRHLSYADARAKVDAIAQALIDRGLGQSDAVMILSGNSIEHALMTYGAIAAGVPVAPVSQAYSLMSGDHAKLKFVFELIGPKVVFLQSGPPFAKALDALDLSGVEIVTVGEAPPGRAATSFESLLATRPGAAVEEAYDRLDHATICKYLFTSGSTGMPKAVINTHGMLCSNAAMAQSIFRDPDRLREEQGPQVIIDWLPWNHTFGGNANLNGILNQGGTMYIDGGRPVPGQFEESLQNLREISPTYYSNVPAAYAVLAGAMERDPELRRTFFKRLRYIAYGGATLPTDLFDRFQALAVAETGERIVFTTGWGSTETAPTATSVYWASERVGLIGLPYPGVELKLVPSGTKTEIRVRGPIVTPGYHKRPDLTAAAFDEEGFYRIGDAARFVDPEDPARGLVFDGRVAEDFKLDTGTWVHAGTLRIKALEAVAPVLQDALVAGQDKPFIGILGFPNVAAIKEIVTDQRAHESLDTLLASGELAEHIRQGLRRHNAANPGSSTRIERALVMTEPPSLDGNEITDKGYINQGAALARRKDLVEKLYADPPGNDVIVA